MLQVGFKRISRSNLCNLMQTFFKRFFLFQARSVSFFCTFFTFLYIFTLDQSFKIDYEKKSETKRSEEHTSELQSHSDLVCRLLLEKKKNDEELRPNG